MQDLNGIADAAIANTPWPEYFNGLRAFHGVGISTITKLAYFFRRVFEEQPALILDEHVAELLTAARWVPLHIPGINRDNAAQHYLTYLQQVYAVSQEINATPDQIEFFLFS